MTWKRAGLAVTAAGGLAVLMSQPLDDRTRLSVRLWIALTAAALVGQLLFDLFRRVPLARSSTTLPSPGRWWARRRRLEPSGATTGLRAAAGLVTRSTESVRTHTNQLRPRLLELAEQVVPRRAVDPQDRIRELIETAGDTGWLIDPSVNDRTPTIDDIDHFLDRILGADETTSTVPRPVTTNR